MAQPTQVVRVRLCMLGGHYSLEDSEHGQDDRGAHQEMDSGEGLKSFRLWSGQMINEEC